MGYAESCEKCPECESGWCGSSWCNGDCTWQNGSCVDPTMNAGEVPSCEGYTEEQGCDLTCDASYQCADEVIHCSNASLCSIECSADFACKNASTALIGATDVNIACTKSSACWAATINTR